MLWSKILVGFASMAACVEAAKDLGTVLRNHPKLTSYYKLIQVGHAPLKPERPC
jgi:hypothetical protein